MFSAFRLGGLIGGSSSDDLGSKCSKPEGLKWPYRALGRFQLGVRCIRDGSWRVATGATFKEQLQAKETTKRSDSFRKHALSTFSNHLDRSTCEDDVGSGGTCLSFGTCVSSAASSSCGVVCWASDRCFWPRGRVS